LINKVQSIQRCVARAREEYSLAASNFKQDYSRQDATILNIIRACEQCIDLGSHIIKTHKIGIPNDSKDIFRLLLTNQMISFQLADNLQKMIGFRNMLVHEYQQINLDIVIAVIENGLDDFIEFCDIMMDIDSNSI
ncbi:MAG: DUF86 domain-containing protein, partial [Proteobacteria bacterium]|nr:DUF86 domain-containing protein [Pseudomonadota bacterium]